MNENVIIITIDSIRGGLHDWVHVVPLVDCRHRDTTAHLPVKLHKTLNKPLALLFTTYTGSVETTR